MNIFTKIAEIFSCWLKELIQRLRKRRKSFQTQIHRWGRSKIWKFEQKFKNNLRLERKSDSYEKCLIHKQRDRQKETEKKTEANKKTIDVFKEDLIPTPTPRQISQFKYSHKHRYNHTDTWKYFHTFRNLNLMKNEICHSAVYKFFLRRISEIFFRKIQDFFAPIPQNIVSVDIPQNSTFRKI